MAFIDIHSHLLPGLDDGSRDWTMTEAMLRQAKEDDIGCIIATTHADPARREFPLFKYMETLEKANLLSRQSGLGVTIYPGAEIMYADSVTERLLEGNRIPSLAGSRHTLVEFYPDVKFGTILAAIRRLASVGYTAVLAHIERYECLYKKYDRIAEIKATGAKLQVNCGSFVKKPGFFAARYLDKLLTDGVIDFLATDAHSDTVRRINMKEAYDIIIKRRPDDGWLFQGVGLGIGEHSHAVVEAKGEPVTASP
ncbi:MAG: protein tyrosine phosphatase [Oscillospiraceae bacterium]|jgi:protein-tyrosine phosphatase|nr:protein tyrosine phosphatase [Oscillospiraceae bacterium]